MSLYFKVKIVGTRPWTSGQEDHDIVEQIITVELPDGIQFGILDGFVMQVKPDMIGKEKDISIIVPVAKIKKISFSKSGIEPSMNNPLSYRGHIYYGKVKQVGVKDIWYNEPGYQFLICIDIGFAEILVDLHKESFQSVTVGDFVEVLASMTTLLKIR